MGEPRVLTVHSDLRGSVREAYRASWDPSVPPIVQVVHSESKPGVMRAMHAHARQYDIWHFIKGEAFVQLYDPRAGAVTFADWVGPADTLVIPPGIAHGFYTASGCILTYCLTREYDGTDEFEFDSLDPEYPGADLWPDAPVGGYIRSRRDRFAPAFNEWLATV